MDGFSVDGSVVPGFHLIGDGGAHHQILPKASRLSNAFARGFLLRSFKGRVLPRSRRRLGRLPLSGFHTVRLGVYLLDRDLAIEGNRLLGRLDPKALSQLETAFDVEVGRGQQPLERFRVSLIIRRGASLHLGSGVALGGGAQRTKGGDHLDGCRPEVVVGGFPPCGKEDDVRRSAQNLPGAPDIRGKKEEKGSVGLAEATGKVIPTGMPKDLLRIGGWSPSRCEENGIVQRWLGDVLH
jgi:hypothetical protein